MITRLGSVESESKSQPVDPNGAYNFGRDQAIKTLAKIQGPWNVVLARLTDQKFGQGSEWQRWWNKNKAKSWKRKSASGRKSR